MCSRVAQLTPICDEDENKTSSEIETEEEIIILAIQSITCDVQSKRFS